MITFLILIVALLPAALLLYYIYRKDPVREPVAWLRKAFFYGALTIIPAALFEDWLSSVLFGDVEPTTILGAAVDAFFIAAIPEEGFKLLALWLVLRKNPYFDEHFDGIVYAVFVSLGFAAVENVFYLFGHSESWITVGIARALLAVPGHYADGVLMGFFYSLYYFVERSRRNLLLIFIAPVVAHGVYDTFVFFNAVSPTVGALGSMCLVYFCIRLHKLCQRKVLAHLKRDESLYA